MRARWIFPGMALAVALAAGAGCATIRHAREVQRGENALPGERTLKAAEIGLNSNSVLSLDEAVRLALAYHPAIAQASQSLAVAESRHREALAAYGPTANASAGYSKGSSNTEEDRSSSATKDSYSASLKADITLCDFGRTPAAARQAREQRLAALAALRSARNDVAFGARAAFLALGKAQELVQVAEEAARQYRSHLDQVKAFAAVGRRIRHDVTKAEVDLGNAELDLVNARSELSNARAALNRSLGLAEEPGCRIAISPASEPGRDVGRVDGPRSRAASRVGHAAGTGTGRLGGG
ncbi:MAG: TolC family protein [Verrucomicrobiota bacterium]|nr:TolC family protein [Verrucomicrobiota bacterium]